jgi:hypothetical protein
MARVEVRQLRYRGELAKAARVEFAIADALRTEVVDDGRLVLVRSFHLGRIGLAERGASLAAASAWRTIREGARHGGTSGAESANCVWFADVAEARTLLMRELASGRTPFAWFWPLAVPDWRRETLAQWLGRRLDEAAHDVSGEAVALLVAEAIAADCVEPLATAMLARVPPPVDGLPREAREQQTVEHGKVPGAIQTHPLQPIEDAACRAVAQAIVRSIPARLRAILALLASRPELAAFVETLARGLVRRAHPALALAPARLATIAGAVERILRLGKTSALKEPRPPRVSPGEAPAGAEEAPRDDPRPTIAPEPSPAFAAASAVESVTPFARPREQLAAPADLFPTELRSSAAGLYLTIAPLVRLGWREWLADRPHLLTHQPGPRLLRRIAEHYRVPATDPLWSQLPPVDPANDPMPELEQALHLWRAGLDGWLRRKARLRLADLVLRQGWLLPGVETTFVRFPLQAIEIGLRRLALDGDPGWVDWLGHSYRVVYRDRPLLGSDLA